MSQTRILEWKDETIELPSEFFWWMERFDPDMWDSAYTGDIYLAYKAWEAGREFGKMGDA